MTRFTPFARSRTRLLLATALVFGALALPAFAQGTDEQREACTPDALKLCQDTIPDIPKTTACMKAHEAELSPGCRAVFSAGAEETPAPDAGDPAPPPRKRRVSRAAPYPDDEGGQGERHYRYRSPDTDEEVENDDVDRARGVIGRMCEDDMIDPRTCAVTERALNRAR